MLKFMLKSTQPFNKPVEDLNSLKKNTEEFSCLNQ